MSFIDNLFYPKPSTNKSPETILQELKHQFKLPIEYNKNLLSLEAPVTDDLESEKLYTQLFGSSYFMDFWTKYYTTDTIFLKEHQSYCVDIPFCDNIDTTIEELHERWNKYMKSENIKDTYFYLDWEHLDFLNYNSKAMMYIGCTSILSPLIALLTPFIFLLMPFVIMKCIMRVDISFVNYKDVLMKYAHKNSFGRCIKMLTEGGNLSTKITGMSMLALYGSSLYQNVLMCIRYYSNLYTIKRYIQDTQHLFKNCLSYIERLEKHTYTSDAMIIFIEDCRRQKREMELLLSKLSCINTSIFSPMDTIHIGKMMSTFYALRYDTSYQKLYQYSFELYHYMKQMFSIQCLIHSGRIQSCMYSKKYSSLKECYHISLLDKESIVKNDVRLKNNYIITGPNASGKTTLIKNVMLNLILSQQLGFGCYNKNTRIYPYENFYSYLNIPDTSNRDSLFQAEARRCLDIIQQIQNKERIFLIFDELYSGTNPYEATIAGIAFLNHIAKFNVQFMITTHYHDICNSPELTKQIKNIHMSFIENKYQYKVVKGKSTKKGGFKVLEDMEYPSEIIAKIKQLVELKERCVPSKIYKCEA